MAAPDGWSWRLADLLRRSSTFWQDRLVQLKRSLSIFRPRKSSFNGPSGVSAHLKASYWILVEISQPFRKRLSAPYWNYEPIISISNNIGAGTVQCRDHG
jgi:hypothetical protein